MSIVIAILESTALSSNKGLWQAPELTVLELFATATGANQINENDVQDNMAS